MSSVEIKALRSEVESLRQLVESVRLGLSELRDRLEQLEATRVPVNGSAENRVPVKEFGTVAQICKRGASCGESIFIGFATRWEAQLACEEAGIEWPGI